jgi:hypothetical protein
VDNDEANTPADTDRGRTRLCRLTKSRCSDGIWVRVVRSSGEYRCANSWRVNRDWRRVGGYGGNEYGPSSWTVAGQRERASAFEARAGEVELVTNCTKGLLAAGSGNLES